MTEDTRTAVAAVALFIGTVLVFCGMIAGIFAAVWGAWALLG